MFRSEYSQSRHSTEAFLLSPETRLTFFRLLGIFNSAIDVSQALVIALGVGLGIWDVINLLEGYGNDNPDASYRGIKTLHIADFLLSGDFWRGKGLREQWENIAFKAQYQSKVLGILIRSLVCCLDMKNEASLIKSQKALR